MIRRPPRSTLFPNTTLCRSLTRWDTGGAVRGAVMASLPVLDGPVGRRISDAVLFVPEGLAVVRIAEVPRQGGVVTALPDGSWTVGPEARRPGERSEARRAGKECR